MRRIGLATQIALPFVILFALLLAPTAALLTYEVLRAMETRIERELHFVLTVAPRFPPTESVLRGLRNHARKIGREDDRGDNAKQPGLELAVLRPHDPPLSTLSQNEERGRKILNDLLFAVAQKDVFPGMGEATSDARAVRRILGGEEFLILYRTFHQGAVYFVLYPESELAAARRGVIFHILLVTAIGFFLAALLGRLTAGRISRPVRRLAAAADRLAGGGLNQSLDWETIEAPEEIGRLNNAFQAMIAALRASQEELVRNERLAVTGRLAAAFAHEIRNPLTAMRMIVQTLRERPAPDATAAEALRLLQSEIDRLALTVDELVSFARPRPLRLRPTDVNGMVKDALAFLERQFLHARVALVFEPDATLPNQLMVDADKMRQLLVNLLLNALQAVVRDGRVTARTRCAKETQTFILEVADTGPGVAPEIRERLFEPFVGVKEGGSGLGLAAVKQIAEEHGGIVAYETLSAAEAAFAGKLPGSIFRVTLPLKEGTAKP
jgi:signal transduction histidine kinase